jgi:hypothetical protein
MIGDPHELVFVPIAPRLVDDVILRTGQQVRPDGCSEQAWSMLPTYEHIFAHVVLVWRTKVKDQKLEQEDVHTVEQELDGCRVEDVVD